MLNGEPYTVLGGRFSATLFANLRCGKGCGHNLVVSIGRYYSACFCVAKEYSIDDYCVTSTDYIIMTTPFLLCDKSNLKIRQTPFMLQPLLALSLCNKIHLGFSTDIQTLLW